MPYHTRPSATLLLGTTLWLVSLSCAAMDAKTLLQQCIPDVTSLSHQSLVEIHVTQRERLESYHFVRLEDGWRLFLQPQYGGGIGFLYERLTKQQSLYDINQGVLLPLSSSSEAPEWLLSESLLDKELLSLFSLTISSQSHMNGQSYYTVLATLEGDDPFPRRSLSFRVDSEQRCDLIRAVYFDARQKLRKKIFVQWQPVMNTKMLKALHIEDVQSLEMVRYHIEDVKLIGQFDPDEFPSYIRREGGAFDSTLNR